MGFAPGVLGASLRRTPPPHAPAAPLRGRPCPWPGATAAPRRGCAPAARRAARARRAPNESPPPPPPPNQRPKSCWSEAAPARRGSAAPGPRCAPRAAAPDPACRPARPATAESEGQRCTWRRIARPQPSFRAGSRLRAARALNSRRGEAGDKSRRCRRSSAPAASAERGGVSALQAMRRSCEGSRQRPRSPMPRTV